MTFFPDCKTKRGPGGSRWRIDRNFCIALTGQVDVLVEPIYTDADFPNLSVLERCLIESEVIVMSLTNKCTPGLKHRVDGAVYSLARRKP